MGMSVMVRFSICTANYCVYKCLNNVFKFSCDLQSSCIDVFCMFFAEELHTFCFSHALLQCEQVPL